MKKIAIFGGSGVVGNFLISQSIERGYQVNALMRAQSIPEKFKNLSGLKVISGRRSIPKRSQRPFKIAPQS